ncbi:MAG: hypothetical protein DRQ65_06880 [Gammaproteobacteria bacterium]|nr:MAG: hypothetical protein DRQ65_06880 [Gammaproteobacteria bacterium]RLA55485.1 MAG: hypothetical protein DRQ98_04995 [Gammaproteobacteria bacterium]HDY81918.1 DUF3313 family protein [Halieaceae bacterium]
MSLKLLPALTASLLILGGCAQNDTADYTAPEKGDPAFLKGQNTRADELYMNPDSSEGARVFRNVYIARADLSHIQVIKPEESPVDDDWKVTAKEEDLLQHAIIKEFTAALGYQSAYNIVTTPEQADMIIHTTVVAIHPNATREQAVAGNRSGGAITASIALINASSGNVMVRSVDTRSSDNIWAFNQVDNDDPAVDLIFRSWGNSMRRGMLHLQGRSSDPLAQPMELKEQK